MVVTRAAASAVAATRSHGNANSFPIDRQCGAGRFLRKPARFLSWPTMAPAHSSIPVKVKAASRKGEMRNSKQQNTKQIQIRKSQNSKHQPGVPIDIAVLIIRPLYFEFVSDFDIRISNLIPVVHSKSITHILCQHSIQRITSTNQCVVDRRLSTTVFHLF